MSEAPVFDSQVQFVRGVVQRLESRESLPLLTPDGDWKDDITATLTQLDADDIFAGNTLAAPEYGEATRAGLLLWNDALDASHTVSQGVENETGSYWHGIMHRREGDFSNSKYWFRNVGSHPVFDKLGRMADTVFERLKEKPLREAGGWDPFTFVDRCEEAVNASDDALALRTLQLYEIKLLLEYSESRALHGV